MFSLIVTVIAIVLVAALALATLYYGGANFNNGASTAQVSRHMAEGQQVQAAMFLYRADNGAFPTGTNEDIKQLLLDQKYLKSWPDGKWELTTGYALRTDITEVQCEAINARHGITGVPSCEDPSITNAHVCCTTLN